jgi:hypothetical protein
MEISISHRTTALCFNERRSETVDGEANLNALKSSVANTAIFKGIVSQDWKGLRSSNYT